MHPKSSQFPISHVKVIPQQEPHGVSDKIILASQKYGGPKGRTENYGKENK